ncbi:2,3-dihydro-2,3-dihydroxybenzoate dehydrogenase [Methylobacillus rhizosphaerae]|uniref:2,3-dihydro-2,3-dihydroxybenzoate dehydrogenase n=1 Tax=Methylobacillus rhizosphaerae TaxID=551994 RepID=A0A238YXJ8_9PROT|nr:2,3-dihydro-2,3-dihydroxybenzoate dehydrogenase [Methylobacillus rhizosphaerae]SNR75835.1 2,3-dihydro-2,3-dihydroxybenzoate dehydrogenase [Methylobacillus rhizosphaerae]
MKGRIALVSGAAQGIGAAVVSALCAHGVRVAALDMARAPLEALAATFPGLVTPYVADLRQHQALEALVDEVERELGPVDMLVNVAGILRMGNLCDLDAQDWDDIFAVNVHGLFHLTRAVAKRMRARRQGSIVTVGSNAAKVPRMQMGAYAASKAAALHFTKCLGLELASHGIRCNIVSPGSTDTAMQRQLWQSEDDALKVIAGNLESYRTGIPLQRIASPEDIAAAVLFLLSNEARHITMHDLCVDGGATLGA